MKNNKLFLRIYISLLVIIVFVFTSLSILGKKTRVGYLGEFVFDKYHIERTLKLNGLYDIKENYIIYGKLDEKAIKQFIFTNNSITNYSYGFRVKYYDKVFRNSDIYGVYIDKDKVLKDNNFIDTINIDGGSPFGNLISSKIIDFDKIDNVNYTLSLKKAIITILFLCIALAFYLNYLFFREKKYRFVFYILLLILIASVIYSFLIQINTLYIYSLVVFIVESILILEYSYNIGRLIGKSNIINKILLLVTVLSFIFMLFYTFFININYSILFIYFNVFFIFIGISLIKKFNLTINIANLFYTSVFTLLFNINFTYNYIVSYNNHSKFIIFFIYSLIVSSFLFIFYIYSEYKNIKLEKIFLLSISVIGFSYFLFLPPMEVPDEGAHYIRAFEISRGLMTYNKTVTNQIGNYLPVEVGISASRVNSYTELIDKFNIKTSGDEYFLGTSALHYFPLSYFPQSLGMFIGRLMHFPIYAEIYLAKLFVLLFFIFSIYVSIKYIPLKKMTIYFLCFFPMVLQQTISFSADSVLIISSFAFISAVLYFRYGDNNIISIKECIILFVLSLLVAMSKSLYIFIFLLIFTIPKEKFKYNKYLTIFSILFFILIIYILWSRNISGYISSANDFDLKKNYILTNPIGYLGIFLNTIDVKGKFYLFSLIGNNLAWFDIPINDFIYYFIVLLILLFITNDYSNKIKLDLKIISFIIICIVYTLILTGLYITWTPIEYDFIEGVQGRYFLPIIFLVFILFNFDYFKHINFKVELDNKIMFIILSMLNINILNTIFNKFFI